MERIDINRSVDTLYFGLKFDPRIQRMCYENGIDSIRELCLCRTQNVLKMPEMGVKSIGQIESVLHQYDLRLNMTGDELDEYAGTERREKAVPAVPSASEEAKWEQRRYEIARDMFVQHRMLAIAAVKEADDLIAALKHRPHA